MPDQQKPWRERPGAEAPLGEREICAFEMIANVEQQDFTHACARGRMNFNCFPEHRPTHNAPPVRHWEMPKTRLKA